MSENPLFRKAALDKLASPERLDVLMRVTSPMGWLSLLTVAGILVGVIVWSILGSIPERISGDGVLLRGGANKEIRSSGSGALVSLELKEGQVISVGQQVGTIAAAGNNEEVNIARTKLQQLEAQRTTTNIDAGAGISAAMSQIARLRGDLDMQKIELQRAQSDVQRLEALLKDGGVTQQRVEGARIRVSQVNTQITSLQGQISAEDNRIRTLRSGGAGLEGQIAVARAELARVMARVGSQETLTSTVAGRVIEIRKNVGDAINQNDVVATLEDASATVQVIAFVNADVGKRIKSGMPTEVSPTDVKREEYGFMLASVSERGEFAASDAYIQSRMRNEAITKKLTGQGTVVEVRAALKPTDATMSGFEWSTKDGPPFKIGGGTLVSINIVVERKAPITLVMPFLRKTFGVAFGVMY
jgi:HlyD family secretion protein